MSALMGLKLSYTAVLATDSRCYTSDRSRILSNAEQKIFEVAPAVFYGWSGYRGVGHIHVQVAATLGRSAETKNLRTFADELDMASQARILQLLTVSEADRCEGELSGGVPFHIYILAGLSEGAPGFLARQFWLRDGRIVKDENYWFGSADNTTFITFGGLIAEHINSPQTWADGPISAADRLMGHLRRVQPLIGGPSQIVSVDRSGARWVRRPPAESVELLCQEGKS